MTDPNDDLRHLFTEATADIRPQGTLDDIRARTEIKADPMTRRWFLPSLVAAAVLGLVIGGGVWLNHDDEPSTSVVPSGTPTSAGPVLETTLAGYFLGDGADGTRLFRVPSDGLECTPAPDCALTPDVNVALNPPQYGGSYRTAWPEGTSALATWDGSLVTVDLSGSSLKDRPGNLTRREAELAVQQLVYSAQGALDLGKPPVQFLVGGAKVATVLGVPASEPITAESPDTALALVSISSPRNAQKFVTYDEITVTGEASAFEANVVWELLVGGDAVVRSGHATAKECCTLSPYSFTIKNLAPGTYTLVVHDTDESGEGRPENRDSREIIVE